MRAFTQTIGVARRSFHCGRTLQDKKAASPSFNAEAVSQQLGVSFKTPNILQRALTHKSYEHGSVPSNERLAYLGARVLQLSACESGLTSSSLQDHVQEHTNLDRLAKKFDGLNLADGMQYHVPGSSMPPKIKATAVNAVIGAVYHDQGYAAAQEFVKKHVL
ncbi:hypothetical protein O0I10_006120 [Lichtheimia ornata]|uniref:RNase III domain-containing protein n=1 Tax=Lichtheimia ornata TaxID=688661 RepID=A0AAD7V2F0_9FUNG|nr:uncharacterized protein O0I10_006120 [Lichtheimia ornata]KAJ8658113.1 hypothetical protein O0I10_006120 [Lichtheimia ornata]